MSTRPPAKVIVLPSAMLHRHQLKMRRRKVKIAVAGVCLLGLMAGLLSIAMETTDERSGEGGDSLLGDESPFRPSSGSGDSMGDGPAWFTTSGSGRGGR
jgi:hypothetical protein